MSTSYEIIESTLRTSSFMVNFEYNIADVKYWDGIYVVLLAIPNGINETDNIYGVNSYGKIIWRIENPIRAFNIGKDDQGYNYLASSVFTLVHLSSDGTFTANTFFAIKYTFDCKTGKLLKKESGRW